jgi:hypothetical protein
MKKGILELIKKIYGSNALSKVLGTRTNVIRLPDNELKQYTNKELNIEAASDKLAQKAKADINELLAEYPRMNDAEKLIFEGNLTRLGNKLGVTEKGPAADVIKFGTGEKVSPEGVMSLTEKIGQKNAPGTLVGNLESRIKQLETSGEELSKLKGKTYDEFMKDITQGQKAMRKLEDEGLVRAAAREIINKDIKSGKIKLPKEIEQDMVQGGGEPINVLRQFYGEGALEQLDSMIPEFKKMYSPKEAADAATKKFKFEFKADRPPGSTSIEDAKKTQVTDLKTEATKRKSVDDLIDEYNANQDRLRLSDEEGGTLIGYEEYEQLRKRNKDISKALEDKGISSKVEKKPEAEIIPFTNKPDPEDFATGGRVGMAGGGILKLAMKFFNDNNPVSAYKKYLKYVKETAQKDPAKLAPEVGGIVVGSELIHRGLRRKLKEVKEKNNENDSENLETDNRTEKAGGGVSQGLDYLTGIERRGYANGTLLDRYKELLNEIENPEETPYIIPSTIPQSEDRIEGRTVETITPIQSSIQQQLTPVGPLDHLVNSYLQVPGILSTAIAMGKDYIGLTDAQKDAYSEYGLGYGNTGIKDAFGYNVFSGMDNWATPGSGSYNAHKASGKTDQQIAEMRDRVMSAPTKADMRAQQEQYGIDQTQRQQDYFDLTNQGLMGIGLNPGAYAAHSLAALGPAYDDFNYTSPFGGSYGGFGRPQAGDLSYTDYSDADIGPMGPQAGDLSYTDYSDKDIGPMGPQGPAEVDRAGDGGDGYATGGRVGYAGGSILKTIGKKIIKKSKKPNLKRQLTDDEIDDLAADVGDLDAYLDFDGTVGSAEKIRKQHKEYMDYMYYQYKTGRLDPKPGEMNTSRMQYLRNKREQAKMTDDPKLFSPNERDELDNLEETFSPMGTSNKINISDPKTAESFTEFAKQNDPEGFKKIEKIVDDINNKNTLENFDITGRKKNAKGGLNYLMGL